MTWWSPLTDVLRLEVETDPPAGMLINQLPNPSGELGGSGYETPVPGSTLAAIDTAERRGLEYTTAANAGGNYFLSEPVPVAPGQYVGISFRWWGRPPGATSYRTLGYRLEWLNAAKAVIGTGVDSNRTPGTPDLTGFQAANMVAPANTAYARLRFEVGNTTSPSFPATAAGIRLDMRELCLVRTDAPVSNPGVNLPSAAKVSTYWTNVLNSASGFKIDRPALDVGTLEALILDVALDPATATMLRGGRKARLVALVDGAWEPVFTGTIDRADVTYDTLQLAKSGSPKHARISLVAVDNTQRLAATGRPDGYSTLAQLPAVLEGAGVPWVVDGNSGQVAAAPITRNEAASALDQIAITRDTRRGYAWVDRNNVLQVWTTPPGSNVNLMDNPGFENPASSWDPVGNGSNASSTEQPASGTRSLRILTGNNGGHVANGPRIPVTPGVSYTFSAKLRAATTSRSVYLYLRYFDAAGNDLGVNNLFGANQPDPVGSWKTLTGYVTAPPDAARVRPTYEVYGAPIGQAGEVHYLDDVYLVPGVLPTLTEADYTDLDVGFNLDEVINEVAVVLLRRNAATGETVEVPYGPYRDETSIRTYGVRSVPFRVQGLADTSAAVSAFAAAILAASATPRDKQVRSLRLPIRSAADLTRAKTLIDNYTIVRIVNVAKGIDQTLRVTSIRHDSTAGRRPGESKWSITLGFTAEAGVAPPQLTPPLAAGSGRTLLDRNHGVYESGVAGAPSTNANGVVSIAHGLGQVPTAVLLTPLRGTNHVMRWDKPNTNAINANVHVALSTTGANVGSTPVAFAWQALA